MASNKIRSVDDLFESVYGTHFVEKKYIFRGQNSVQWKIKPQLTRVEVNDELKVFELSSFLPLHQNRKIPFLIGKDPIEYLSILQHYQVRTRLLDWSKDALVALFFACFDPKNDNMDFDGEFIVIDSSYFPDISLRSIENQFFINEFNDLPSEQYKSRINNLEIKYFEPVFQNPRSRSQNGCFLYFPFATINSNDTEYPCLEQYVKYVNKKNESEGSENRMYLAKKSIDKEYKEMILKELEEYYSISYETLMIPDSNNLRIDLEFKNFVDQINQSSQEMNEAYKKWNVANKQKRQNAYI